MSPWVPADENPEAFETRSVKYIMKLFNPVGEFCNRRAEKTEERMGMQYSHGAVIFLIGNRSEDDQMFYCRALSEKGHRQVGIIISCPLFIFFPFCLTASVYCPLP
jgi:hypothetical protein